MSIGTVVKKHGVVIVVTTGCAQEHLQQPVPVQQRQRQPAQARQQRQPVRQRLLRHQRVRVQQRLDKKYGRYTFFSITR